MIERGQTPRTGTPETSSPLAPAAGRALRRDDDVLRDRAIRLIGVPFFGIVIPLISGLFGPLSVDDIAYWAGTLWFVLISFVVWQGNRTLQIWHRARFDWANRPLMKLVALVSTNLIYTTPVSVAMLLAWYLAAPLPGPDWNAIALATGLIVAAVLFITHAYETVYLIREQRDDRMQVALTERARWQAELEALKGQLAPHFLFNCLNTLAVLIDEEPRLAHRFNQRLASVCRYLLKHKGRDLVSLEEELEFFHAYVELTRVRFLENVQVAFHGFETPSGLYLPPASLQLLLENALKHNICTPSEPLPIEVCLTHDALVMSNPMRPHPSGVNPASGIGLQNLRDRFALVVRREIEVTRDDGCFRVRLPLVRL